MIIAMNSKKRIDRDIKDPLFKYDPETGKKILLPIKWTSPNTAAVKSSDKRAKRILAIKPLTLTSADFEEYSPETRNKKLLPIKWTSSNTAAVKSSDKSAKRILAIKPLTLTSADFEEAPKRANKVRKKDNNSVRKELFNFPAKGSQISRPSINTRQTLSKRSVTSQKAHQKKFKPCELSPLLDMEKVEEELIRKRGFIQGYPFKAPSKPVIKFRENSESSPFKEQGKLNEKNTPKIIVTRATVDSTSSNEAEFLELEKICCVEGSEKNNECARSPISSICNLLEGTVINSIKKNKVAFPNVLQNISKLENILTESKTAVEEYTINRERNISKITELLENDKKEYENLVMLQNRNNNVVYGILKELKCAFSNTVSDIETNKEENKENTPVHNRRSRRLLNKSPIQTDGAKLIVSPVVLKSKDLRKTTLTKNLVTRSQQYNIESPRLQKALDMYNSMRCEITLLATPKFDRNYLQESPRSSNLSRNLSRRVQNQCLLLQDTPIHK